MSSLALFAETPRAGERGHRFLVAANSQLSEPRIAEFLERAQKDVSFGANFIGVSHSVQQVSGTAVRTGREIIVLAGVDVSRIPDPSRDRLLALLRELLNRLEHLVLRGIDWSRLPPADLLVRTDELSQWLDEVQALNLPETEWHSGPRPVALTDAAPTSKRGLQVPPAVLGFGYGLLFSLIVILLVVWVWLRGTSQNGADGNVAQPDPERSHPAKPLDIKKITENIAAEWACSPDDVVRSLLRAANWDRRHEADSLSFEAGLKDGEVQHLLRQVTSKDGVEQLLVSPAIGSEPDFHRFALNHRLSPTASRDLRKWLYDAWEEWDKLRKAVDNANGPLSGAENGDDLTRMMGEIARLHPGEGFGVGFRAPTTPLFDRQDVMIWDFLDQCRVEMENRGINQFLGKPVISPPASEASELASFLAAVRANRGQILSCLAGSRSQAAGKVGKSQGREDEKSVTSAFRAFEDFIEHLARFDHR
jgi:hypothetical protein